MTAVRCCCLSTQSACFLDTQAATSVVASVIHSKYIGLDMTRKLSVPCNAPMQYNAAVTHDTPHDKPAAPAQHSVAANVSFQSFESHQPEDPCPTSSLPQLNAEPESAAQSATERPSESSEGSLTKMTLSKTPQRKPQQRAPFGQEKPSRSPLRKQQQTVAAGQTEHHVAFRLRTATDRATLGKRSAAGAPAAGLGNPFGRFSCSETAKSPSRAPGKLKAHHYSHGGAVHNYSPLHTAMP
jgi:hypothetical protein